MAAYEIWFQTIAVSNTLHVATVCAVAARSLYGAKGVHSETRIFNSGHEAGAEVPRMAKGMRDKLLAEGHEIRAVSFLGRR
jgi:hypothetical protein